MKFHVDKMKCAHCVAAVKGALEQIPGCTGAAVSLESATAEVQGDIDAGLAEQTLTDLGYPANRIDG